MRPTDLHFRSPKERTGEFLYPLLTSTGQKIPISHKQPSKGTFSLSHRFPDYKFLASKTGLRVGPGAYELSQLSIGRASIKGTPSYHKPHGNKDLTNNGYIYVGNSVMFEPSLINKKLNTEASRADASQVTKTMSESRNRRHLQDTADSTRKASWLFSGSPSNEKQTSRSFIEDRSKKDYFTLSRELRNSPKFV